MRVICYQDGRDDGDGDGDGGPGGGGVGPKKKACTVVKCRDARLPLDWATGVLFFVDGGSFSFGLAGETQSYSRWIAPRLTKTAVSAFLSAIRIASFFAGRLHSTRLPLFAFMYSRANSAATFRLFVS